VARADLPTRIVASGFGLGYLPLAPGTWASGAGAALYWLLRRQVGFAAQPIAALLAAAALGLGLLVADRAEAAYGDDPGQFVLDELAGCWLVCALFWWRPAWQAAAAALVTFRIFDVAKPFPIRRLERLPGGWGIMADDLAAGLFSVATLWPLCYGILKMVRG
jgi:phosphatidylglycerophosphatase A